MANPFTPADTAWLDQRLAERSGVLEAMVVVARKQLAEVGREQLVANMILAYQLVPQDVLVEMMIAVMLRLAEQDPEVPRG